MRALWMTALAAVLLSGCNFGLKKCSATEPCTDTGTTCDLSVGFCVKGDGGVAGGGGGGGSGGGGGTTGGGGGGMAMCNPACTAGYLCESAVCVLHVTGVQIDAPTANFATNDSGVAFSAHLLTNATVSLPPSIQYRVDSAPAELLPDVGGGTYSTTVQLDAGMYRLHAVAGFPDASFESFVDVVVDLEGPVLTPAQPLPTGTLRRDEIFRVELSSNEALQGPVQFELDGIRLDAGAGCVGDAGCWDVDLSVPALNSLSGAFALTATATDRLGNTKQTALGTLSVSRVRWAIPLTSDELRASPAVGRDGTVFLGSRAGAGTGSLYAVSWDGGVRNSVTVGAFQSVAAATSTTSSVTQEVVFYTANDSQGRVGSRRASDLSGTGVQAPQAGLGSSVTYTAVALVAASGGEIGALTAFNSSSVASRLVVYGPASGTLGFRTAPDGGGTFDMGNVPPLDSPSNLVVDGTTATLAARPGGVGLVVQRITGLPSSIVESTAVPIDGDSSSYSLGLAHVGPNVLFGGVGPMVRNLYRVNATATVGNLGAAVDNGVPSVLDTNTAFIGRGSDVVRFNPQTLTVAGTPLISGVTVRTAPIIGKARGGEPKKGYAVTSTGSLLVFDVNGAMNSGRNLGQPFGMNETIAAHPTLDCNRRPGASTANTGILYIATVSGKLAAIIVDSPKLDDAAFWPKYQRTIGNAGNTDDASFPINWSTCPN